MYQPLTIYLGLYSKAEIMLFVKIYRLLILKPIMKGELQHEHFVFWTEW